MVTECERGMVLGALVSKEVLLKLSNNHGFDNSFILKGKLPGQPKAHLSCCEAVTSLSVFAFVARLAILIDIVATCILIKYRCGNELLEPGPWEPNGHAGVWLTLTGCKCQESISQFRCHFHGQK